eukprot:Ihof_evm3s219 gene=Ihof_evmTU3s219
MADNTDNEGSDHSTSDKPKEIKAKVSKPKRYRRKATELDNIFLCSIRACRKKYGSMSALRLHMSMKHSLKRSGNINIYPNICGGLVYTASCDCNLGSILPDMPSLYGSPRPLPNLSSRPNDIVKKPSPLTDKFFPGTAVMPNIGTDYSLFSLKKITNGNTSSNSISNSNNNSIDNCINHKVPQKVMRTFSDPLNMTRLSSSNIPTGSVTSISCPDCIFTDGFGVCQCHDSTSSYATAHVDKNLLTTGNLEKSIACLHCTSSYNNCMGSLGPLEFDSQARIGMEKSDIDNILSTMKSEGTRDLLPTSQYPQSYTSPSTYGTYGIPSISSLHTPSYPQHTSNSSNHPYKDDNYTGRHNSA